MIACCASVFCVFCNGIKLKRDADEQKEVPEERRIFGRLARTTILHE